MDEAKSELDLAIAKKLADLKGLDVRIDTSIRLNEIGKVTGVEKTPVGWRLRVEFPNGQAGLYAPQDLRQV